MGGECVGAIILGGVGVSVGSWVRSDVLRVESFVLDDLRAEGCETPSDHPLDVIEGEAGRGR